MRALGWLGMGLLAGLGWTCSGDSPRPMDGEDGPPVADSPLVGSWVAVGEDQGLGEVTVRLTLRGSGRLDVVVRLAAGGQLSFGGNWEAGPDSLFLAAAYFEPDGQARVAYAVQGDSLLVLRAGEGTRQEWRRD
ncbi:MAG: hypothetical protein ABIL09_18100 [Gemmatimonadota bacterium]